jgi:DNA-binding NtrC family response regulator
MKTRKDKILIIDEESFLRICSSILETEGFATETITAAEENWASKLTLHDYGLVISSYPYGKFIFKELKELALPVIVLSDHISEDIMGQLEGFRKSYCMVKPIDYVKFKLLVKKIMNGVQTPYASYNLV